MSDIIEKVKRLLDKRPLPKVNWECHFESGYAKAIEDVLELLKSE